MICDVSGMSIFCIDECRLFVQTNDCNGNEKMQHIETLNFLLNVCCAVFRFEIFLEWTDVLRLRLFK